MRDDLIHDRPYRVTIVTLDAHAAGPCGRAQAALRKDFPGLEIDVHAAAQWGEDPSALAAAVRVFNRRLQKCLFADLTTPLRSTRLPSSYLTVVGACTAKTHWSGR